MEITIAKTVSDAINRLVNKSGTGLKALIAAKLDKATADTYYWKRTEKVTNATNADNATKATNDGNGNNIATTYAKKSDIPASADLSAYLKKTDADAKYLYRENGGYYIKGRVSFTADNDTSFITGSNDRLSLITANGALVLQADAGQFAFKSDGIYLNGTKITN